VLTTAELLPIIHGLREDRRQGWSNDAPKLGAFVAVVLFGWLLSLSHQSSIRGCTQRQIHLLPEWGRKNLYF
jgi:hypothetical protein